MGCEPTNKKVQGEKKGQPISITAQTPYKHREAREGGSCSHEASTPKEELEKKGKESRPEKRQYLHRHQGGKGDCSGRRCGRGVFREQKGKGKGSEKRAICIHGTGVVLGQDHGAERGEESGRSNEKEEFGAVMIRNNIRKWGKESRTKREGKDSHFRNYDGS